MHSRCFKLKITARYANDRVKNMKNALTPRKPAHSHELDLGDLVKLTRWMERLKKMVGPPGLEPGTNRL